VDSTGTAALGGLFILGGFVVALALMAFVVWAFVDVLRRPRQQWEVAGQQQVVWVVALAVGTVMGLGAVAALVYVLVPLPRLREAGQATRLA
jgi:UDP-N-acetylmuramyl pentapeptide phosphotransferase/UDP-N-acetylglucosamine-1-phosphate transferase